MVHDHVRIETMLFVGAAAALPGGLLRPDLSRSGHGLDFRDEAASPYRIAWHRLRARNDAMMSLCKHLSQR
jgi:hypothetical protein